MSTGFRVSEKVNKVLLSTDFSLPVHWKLTQNPPLEKCNTFMSTITKEFCKKRNPQNIAQYETLIKYNKQNKQKSLQCGNILSLTGPSIRTILEKISCPLMTSLAFIISFCMSCQCTLWKIQLSGPRSWGDIATDIVQTTMYTQILLQQLELLNTGSSNAVDSSMIAGTGIRQKTIQEHNTSMFSYIAFCPLHSQSPHFSVSASTLATSALH